MFRRNYILLLSVCCCVVGISACLVLASCASRSAWRVSEVSGEGIDVVYKHQPVLVHNNAMVNIDGIMYRLSDATYSLLTHKSVSDPFGTGVEYHHTGTIAKDVHFDQVYCLYDNAPYMMTRLTLSANHVISSNYMAPVVTNTSVHVFPQGEDNRVLFVPYDNDEWITYASYPFGRTQNTYEVGALYSETSHKGFVLGSIEHTDWKSAVTTTTLTDGTLSALTLYAGAADSITRDSIPHGALRGTTISSPLMMMGVFDDWREGMETYADLCATVAPKRSWNGGKPFVWNSWGVIAEHLNRHNAFESAEFIAENLYTNGFQNQGTCYVGLDSFWDHMTEKDLVQFAAYCHSQGMKAGIYWTPFVDWAAKPNRHVEGLPDSVHYKDLWLYRNGQPAKRNNACALDPTHPYTKERAEYNMHRFIAWGYDYLKMDFMIHGALEADRWYDTTITTGTQAYNQGMHYLDSLAGDQLYLNLSIAPVFPAHYAQGRRIACDAWGAVKDTKYTLNATTYSWWLDHVYSYNDGDHVVLRHQNEGVNRLRLTSSLVTGTFCLGDDFSARGDFVAKQRAVNLACNPRVSAMARETNAFRPVTTPIGNEPADMFYYTTPAATYVAIFNFDSVPVTHELNLTAFDLVEDADYTVTELWSGDTLQAVPKLVKEPPTDCLIYKFEHK